MYQPWIIIIVGLFFSLANFWIWRIVNLNPFIGILLIVLSAIFGYLFYVKFDKKIFLIAISIILIITHDAISVGFDKNLIEITADQQRIVDARHGHFAANLGILFQNKFSLHYYNKIGPHIEIYLSNIFNSLSPNLYFFANHPRERGDVAEFIKYPFILIASFLIGFVYTLNGSKILLSLYLLFSLLVSGLIKQTYLLGPILFFPLINLLIIIGFLRIIKLFKK